MAFLDVLNLTDIWKGAAYAFFDIHSSVYPDQIVDHEAVPLEYKNPLDGQYDVSQEQERVDQPAL